MIKALAHVHARDVWLRAVRIIAGAAPRDPVRILPGRSRPVARGEPGYYATPSGKTIVRHPSAYGWRTVYHCSTYRVEVGAAYLPPARALRAATPVRPVEPTRAELRRAWYASGPGALATTRLGMRAAMHAWRVGACDDGARECIAAANAIDGAEHWTIALAATLTIARWIDTYTDATAAELRREASR